MSKVSYHLILISEYLSKGEFGVLKEYLKANSNLPGPRGNLEMAYAFGNCFDAAVEDRLWEFLLELSEISEYEAPTGDPAEMFPFCAALAAGSYYAHADVTRKARIRDILRSAMNDMRWRMREAAAMGYQSIAEKDFDGVKAIFDALYSGSNYLEKRGIIAALAHPPILKVRDIALYSLRLSENIMSGITALSAEELKSDEFKVLSKGLEYALSVFAAHAPEEGFMLLKRFAAMFHKDIRRIVKSNIGKARLKDKFPGQTNEVMRMLEV